MVGTSLLEITLKSPLALVAPAPRVTALPHRHWPTSTAMVLSTAPMQAI